MDLPPGMEGTSIPDGEEEGRGGAVSLARPVIKLNTGDGPSKTA